MATMAPSPGKRSLFEPEHDDYRESYARFLQKEVVPHYPEWERNQLVPRELFTKFAEYGFLAMEIPEEYGGNGVSDWRFNVVLAEEGIKAGVGDAVAGPLLHSDVVVPYLMASAAEEQRRRWFPSVAAGEQILAIAMTEPGTGRGSAAVEPAVGVAVDTEIERDERHLAGRVVGVEPLHRPPELRVRPRDAPLMPPPPAATGHRLLVDVLAAALDERGSAAARSRRACRRSRRPWERGSPRHSAASRWRGRRRGRADSAAPRARRARPMGGRAALP